MSLRTAGSIQSLCSSRLVGANISFTSRHVLSSSGAYFITLVHWSREKCLFESIKACERLAFGEGDSDRLMKYDVRIRLFEVYDKQDLLPMWLF